MGLLQMELPRGDGSFTSDETLEQYLEEIARVTYLGGSGLDFLFARCRGV